MQGFITPFIQQNFVGVSSKVRTVRAKAKVGAQERFDASGSVPCPEGLPRSCDGG
jgi:hypothetical protein